MDNEKIIKKGFACGGELKRKIKDKKKENQIDGIVYSLLNDLKINDREKFLDKYIRLMTSNNMAVSFGVDEMNDLDCFLQFGYSFVSGLKSYDKNEDKNKGENQ